MRYPAIHRAVATDPGAYHRWRWRARCWTAVVVVVVVVAVVDIATLVASDSERARASAAWVFFQTGLVLGVLAPVLWFQWRRSSRARPQRLDVAEGPGAWRGVPELDEPSGRHLTLGRPDVELPRRW